MCPGNVQKKINSFKTIGFCPQFCSIMIMFYNLNVIKNFVEICFLSYYRSIKKSPFQKKSCRHLVYQIIGKETRKELLRVNTKSDVEISPNT